MRSDPNDFHAIIQVVNDALEGYIAESRKGEIKIGNQIPASNLADKLQVKKWISEGGLNSQNVQEFLDPYLKHSQRMHHPHYIGHQVSVPHLASGVSDFIHGAINNPMAIYEMGPSAAVIEKTMVNWLLSKVGWLPNGDIAEFGDIEGNGTGVFTHGGSMANLTALLAARAKVTPEAWNEGNDPDVVVIGSDVAHYSIARAISIMGMGKNNLWKVAVDKDERMIPDELEREIAAARSAGKKIMCVVANACATSTGLYDPIEEVALICQRHDVWFHVDGAHGASALLCPSEKHFMKGAELANSMIWDTHKMLRTTTLAAAVLFKDPHDMLGAFQQKGSYLFHDKENLGFDLMPYTIECTKAPLATKLFWVLAAEGEHGLSGFVQSRYEVTREMHDWFVDQADFECPYYPEANILCFRYAKLDESNEFQLSIRNNLVAKGNFYITSTEIANVRYLRMTVINPDTNVNHIKALAQEIRSIATELLH